MRICPGCGQPKLPLIVFRRDRIRICRHCGEKFVDRRRPLFLVQSIQFAVWMGSIVLLFEFFDYLGHVGIAMMIMIPWAVIVGAWLPAYAINRTVPIEPLGGAINSGLPRTPDQNRNYTLVLLMLTVLAGVSAWRVSVFFGSLFPADLRTLNLKREQQLPELANALNEYKKSNGCYPTELKVLVPDFIPELRQELDPHWVWDDFIYSISYRVINENADCSAFFKWWGCRGPDCGWYFNVATGEISHDE